MYEYQTKHDYDQFDDWMGEMADEGGDIFWIEEFEDEEGGDVNIEYDSSPLVNLTSHLCPKSMNQCQHNATCLLDANNDPYCNCSTTVNEKIFWCGHW